MSCLVLYNLNGQFVARDTIFVVFYSEIDENRIWTDGKRKQ